MISINFHSIRNKIFGLGRRYTIGNHKSLNRLGYGNETFLLGRPQSYHGLARFYSTYKSFDTSQGSSGETKTALNYKSNDKNHSSKPPRKVTVRTLQYLRRKNRPIVCLTAYDYPSAMFCKQSGVDLVLVGDSLAMTALGYEDTVEITLDEMIHHCKAVARGINSKENTFDFDETEFSNGENFSKSISPRIPLMVGDLPFGSYHESEIQAIRSATRMVKEGKMEAIKMEGGIDVSQIVKKLVNSVGIPVLGHIGLQPQHKNSLGGYKIVGKTTNEAVKLLDDAYALQNAGCFAIVLEAIPPEVAVEITSRLSIPTIGIGSGGSKAPLSNLNPDKGSHIRSHTNVVSGQILVQHDMLGYYRSNPMFVKKYEQTAKLHRSAISSYVHDVRNSFYPAAEHLYPPMPSEEYQQFLQQLHLNNPPEKK